MGKSYRVDVFGYGSGYQADVYNQADSATSLAEIRPMRNHPGLFTLRLRNGTTISSVTKHDAFGLFFAGEARKE